MNITIKGHQGDVFVKQLTSLPKEAIKIKQKPLALGEHSGHMHVLTGEVELFEFEGKIIAVVGSDGACIQHVHDAKFKDAMYKTKKVIGKADHFSREFEAGIYEFTIQNAYNPFKKVFERVID